MGHTVLARQWWPTPEKRQVSLQAVMLCRGTVNILTKEVKVATRPCNEFCGETSGMCPDHYPTIYCIRTHHPACNRSVEGGTKDGHCVCTFPPLLSSGQSRRWPSSFQCAKPSPSQRYVDRVFHFARQHKYVNDVFGLADKRQKARQGTFAGDCQGVL